MEILQVSGRNVVIIYRPKLVFLIYGIRYVFDFCIRQSFEEVSKVHLQLSILSRFKIRLIFTYEPKNFLYFRLYLDLKSWKQFVSGQIWYTIKSWRYWRKVRKHAENVFYLKLRPTQNSIGFITCRTLPITFWTVSKKNVGVQLVSNVLAILVFALKYIKYRRTV